MQTVNKPVDRTRTARQEAHLVRLNEAMGKRMVVDLDQESNASLVSLLASGYAQTQVAVVRKALIAAAKKIKKA